MQFVLKTLTYSLLKFPRLLEKKDVPNKGKDVTNKNKTIDDTNIK